MNLEKLGTLKSLYFKIAPDALTQMLTCPICLGTLSRPQLTSCGHSFCADCIAAQIEVAPRCPVCRATLRGPVYVCPNVALERLVEYLNAAPRMKSGANTNPFISPARPTEFRIGRKAHYEGLTHGTELFRAAFSPSDRSELQSCSSGPEPMEDVVGADGKRM